MGSFGCSDGWPGKGLHVSLRLFRGDDPSAVELERTGRHTLGTVAGVDHFQETFLGRIVETPRRGSAPNLGNWWRCVYRIKGFGSRVEYADYVSFALDE
jgi:hypothetical protein